MTASNPFSWENAGQTVPVAPEPQAQTAQASQEEKAIEATIRELIEVEAKEDQLKQRKKELQGVIECQFPEGEIGEWMRKFGAYQVTFKRGEKLEWDTDTLKELVEAGEVPDHIKLKLSVDKRKYDALPQNEKDKLLPALTIKPGTVKIEVESAAQT